MYKAIPTTIASYEFADSSKNLHLYLDPDSAKEVCLSLLLLTEGLTDSVKFSFKNFTLYLELTKEGLSFCHLIDLQENVFKGAISMDSLGYWIHFMLEYYRDGVGKVDHIDLEFKHAQLDFVDLTIEVAVSYQK